MLWPVRARKMAAAVACAPLMPSVLWCIAFVGKQEELAVRLGLASKQHVSRMENGKRSCSIDLLIELSCILHVSTDYLLMGSEPSKEEVKNDLLSIISELSRIAKKL